LVGSFTEKSYNADESKELKNFLSGESQNHTFWNTFIHPEKLNQIASQNRFQLPRSMNLSDLLENGILGVTPNSSSSPIFNKNKLSRKNVWKQDKKNKSQYFSGLVGIDWTNPLFEGSFVHGHSSSVDLFKHQIMNYLIMSNTNRGRD
jgi:hypothetical protein